MNPAASQFHSEPGPVDDFVAAHPEHRTWEGRDLAFVPTAFDEFAEGLCRALVYRGWWLAGAHLARWAPASHPLPALGSPPPM